MTDTFLKKIYFKVKELFEQKENPLYNTFYKEEETGFESFKNHLKDDEELERVLSKESLSDFEVSWISAIIINKINKYYYMSGQGN